MSKSRIKNLVIYKNPVERLEGRKARHIYRVSILSIKEFLLLRLAAQVGEKKRQIHNQ